MANPYVIDDALLDDTEPKLTAKMLEQAKPLNVNVDARPQPTSWFTILLLCVIAFFIGTQVRSCSLPLPIPDDRVVIDEDGKFVLVLQDKSEAGQDRLSKGQAEAINSTKVKDWCEANGFAYRSFDAGDDLSTVEPVWQALKQLADDAPSLTAAAGGRARTGPMPDGSANAIKLLESVQ